MFTSMRLPVARCYDRVKEAAERGFIMGQAITAMYEDEGRLEAARKALGAAGPLSELIMAERDGR